jgi:hypothetical protein
MSDHRNPDLRSNHDPNPELWGDSATANWSWFAVIMILAFVVVIYMMVDGHYRIASNEIAPPTTKSERVPRPTTPKMKAESPPATPGQN